MILKKISHLKSEINISCSKIITSKYFYDVLFCNPYQILLFPYIIDQSFLANETTPKIQIIEGSRDDKEKFFLKIQR